jgi:hypothetical protein
MCGNPSPCRPIADGLHYYLNDGCKLSLDDTFGNRRLLSVNATRAMLHAVES